MQHKSSDCDRHRRNAVGRSLRLIGPHRCSGSLPLGHEFMRRARPWIRLLHRCSRSLDQNGRFESDSIVNERQFQRFLYEIRSKSGMERRASWFARAPLRSFVYLRKSEPNPGTTGSKVCGGAVDSVLFHSNSNAKTFVAANIACTPGQSFSVTAYVVFSYASPFVILTSQVLPLDLSFQSHATTPDSATLILFLPGHMRQRHRSRFFRTPI
jgi:hypothetical protein